MPFVTAVRIGNVVKLAWNESDTGNLALNGFDIYSSTASGNEKRLTSLGNVRSLPRRLQQT